MKTSNKILLALFLLPFIAVTFVAFSFYSRYKSGKYITQEQYTKEKEISTIVSSFNTIDLSSYRGTATIKASDSFAIVVFNWDKDKVIPKVKDGVLTLHYKNEDNYAPVTILCPSVTTITADSVEISVGNVLRNATINAKTESRITLTNNADSLVLNIDRNANVNLGANIIQKLQLNLANGAELDASESTVISFENTTIADSATVKIGGKTMKAFLNQNSKTQ
ncbi:MAG: DUF2807 domain-containing protein [Chitinophagaceae bacterium]|nr:DUF2807 domain-containing protein [Chitinophagaceae bacterium]